MILEARRLGKTFGDFTALQDISLHLERGEVVGFLGPNGAGKSTTMHLLTGYLAPTTGTATINGHDLADDPLSCRRQIGYLPQEPPLYPDMKVEGYLDHVARLKGILRERRRAEVGRVLEFADLAEVRRRHIHKLSGGNRQRVGLAQALIGTPPILILDEATAGLDPAQVANLRELLAGLADEHGVLLSTHIMGEVEACCSRVIVIDHGRLLLATTVAELRRRCGSTTRLALRLLEERTAEFCECLRTCDWATGVSSDGDAIRLTAPADRRRELVELAQTCGGLRELVEERRSLEELFRELIS